MSAGPGNPKEFIFKPKGNREKYNETLKSVRSYIPAMSKALSCKSQESEYELHGLPSGKLNTNRLVAFRAGNRNIFDKQGSVTCSSASVIMLIDESGSMSGSKERAARQAAILINEAIARIQNVNFYCYGYTDNELTVYSESAKTSKWALSDTRSIGGTPTGRAMELAAKRVRQFTKDPAIMLVLTDGHPDNVRTVVQQVEALPASGISPIGIGIQSNAVSKCFKEYLVMEQISNLATELGKLTKSKLNKILVRTDSSL